jgi:hypothetical protein
MSLVDRCHSLHLPKPLGRAADRAEYPTAATRGQDRVAFAP